MFVYFIVFIFCFSQCEIPANDVFLFFLSLFTDKCPSISRIHQNTGKSEERNIVILAPCHVRFGDYFSKMKLQLWLIECFGKLLLVKFKVTLKSGQKCLELTFSLFSQSFVSLIYFWWPVVFIWRNSDFIFSKATRILLIPLI